MASDAGSDTEAIAKLEEALLLYKKLETGETGDTEIMFCNSDVANWCYLLGMHFVRNGQK